MKIKINESKLERIIFHYLDDKNFFIKETSDNYFFTENEDKKYAIIKVRKRNMACYINGELKNEIKSFFSLETLIAKEFITRYVEHKLGVKISYSELYGGTGFNVV